METNGTATSFGILNYSGLLYNKGNTKTPFLTMIMGKTKFTQNIEFVTGQEFTSEDGEIPAISENASLTAPEPSYVKREQKTNVTQIFMDAVAVSYAKMSNMRTLSGLNVSGQSENPISELDFQVARKMEKLGRQIENTFINGNYNKAATDSTVNKTRGMVEAITSNVVTNKGRPLTIWDVQAAVSAISKSQGDTEGLVLWCDNTSLLQLNADAVTNSLTIVEAGREVNGIQLKKLILPTATVFIREGQFLPAGTALLINFEAVAPVEQPVPGKGNFFLEPLAKKGAADAYQLFGQIGLDHGPEWFHAKITGISTTFTAPDGVKNVRVKNAESDPVNTKEVANSPA